MRAWNAQPAIHGEDGNGHWRGGSYVASDGYRYVRVKNDNGRTRYRLEHRLVMERFLGRDLRRDEHVHHRNGDKLDNRVQNLEVLGVAEHYERHREAMTEMARRRRKPLPA